MQPKVSVCIPVYNAELYLEECLESVCLQTLKEIEIICVNDGSTDRSLQILHKFADRDSRIVIINQENSGAACARNVAIRHAKGIYIFFLDSDDYLANDALEILTNIMQNRDLQLCFYNAKAFGEKDVEESRLKIENQIFRPIRGYPLVYKGEELFKLLKDNKDYRATICMQIKREFLIKESLWFQEGIMHEDVLFAYRCLLLALRAGYVENILYFRRVRNNSLSGMSLSEKNLFSILSFFTCLKQMLAFCYEIKYQKENEEAIFSEIEGMLRTCQNRYSELEDDDKRRLLELTGKDDFLFKELISKPYDKTVREKKLIQEKKLVQELADQLDRELNDVKSGWSFRLGRIITFFPRKIRTWLN